VVPAQALAQVPAAVVSVQVPVPTAVVLARVSAQVPVLVAEAWVAKAARQVEALAPGLEEEAAAVALPPASPASERR